MAHFLIPRLCINSNYAQAVHTSLRGEVSVSGFLSELPFHDKLAGRANIPHCQRYASHTSGGLFIRQCHNWHMKTHTHTDAPKHAQKQHACFYVCFMGNSTYIITHSVTHWWVKFELDIMHPTDVA